MPPIFLLTIVYFLFVSFISGSAEVQATNPFLAYYELQIKFVFHNWGIFFWVFVFVALLFFVSNITKGRKIFIHLLRLIKQTFAIVVVGSLSVFLLLLVVALMEINFFSALTHISSRLLGVEEDSIVIAKRITKQTLPPTIIAGGGQRNILPITLAIASAGKNSFYAGKIVASIPSFLIIPAKKIHSGVLGVSDSLIINEINSPDFQRISPVISYLMIKRYFPKRFIKSYPAVNLMTEEEYLSFRKDDFNTKLKKFDEVVAKIQEDSVSLSASVEDLKNQISENELEFTALSARKEKDYTKCINAGYYESGVYHKTNSQEYCQEQIADLEEEVASLKKEGEDLSTSLQDTLSEIEQYKVYEKYYGNQKLLTEESSSYISYEFGTFEPPGTIKIALSLENNSQAVADYLELLIHEYLHYTRYEENGIRIGSAFFDEGLTEYFARNIVKQSMGVDTNLGYPVNVKIISQITKRVAESDLADVYFSNDQPTLETLLDRVYGKDFYQNNEVLFETLHYSSDTNQILMSGNEIMSEIGGDKLNAGDLKTSFSTFR